MLRLLIIIITLLPLTLSASAPVDAGKIKKEQREAKQAIKEGKKKLEGNKREISRQMKQLSSLEKEIGAREVEISRLAVEVSELDRGIEATTSDIDSLTLELQTLRDGYRKALRKIQSVRIASDPLSFLFSSSSMNDFFTRLRHVREFNRWRRERERAISSAAAELSERQQLLSSRQQSQRTTLNSLNSNRALLKSKQSETDRLVAQLKKEGGEMQAELDRRQKQLNSLNKELNRIIEADRRTRAEKAARSGKSKKKTQTPKKKSGGKTVEPTPAPATEQIAEEDRVLNGSFESNKGRLLFPVSGKYRVVRGFGLGRYSSKVQTSHVGIDIEVPLGAQARAIFEGVVTNVSHLDGFNTIVVVRHGSYLTVYVNLASASVRAGQTVTKGQLIGQVAADDSGRNGLLQFGLRKERTELNPLLWVK